MLAEDKVWSAEQQYNPRLPKKTVFGYVLQRGKHVPIGVPSEDVQNTILFGAVKSGKSTTLELLMKQDIHNGVGFLFIDPHAQAGNDIVSLIPASQRHRLVYLSLSSPYDFDGYTHRINPLEFESDDERFDIVSGFISMLEHHFTSEGRMAWGPRLEMVLRHSVHLLLSVNDFHFGDVMNILSDEKSREHFLRMCSFLPTIDFFNNTFGDLPDEAKTAVQNKIDAMISTPSVMMFLDAVKSTISMARMIREGKIVIVNLHSGANSELVELVGSIILHMIVSEGKKRQKQGFVVHKPFNIYVDEAHYFSPSVLRDLLNTVRKFGMKVTLATQTVDKLDNRFAKELPALCQTVISFSSSDDTEKVLSGVFPIDKGDITQLSRHSFRLWAKSDPPISVLGITKKINHVSSADVRDVILESLRTGGTRVDMNTYMPPLRNKKGFGPSLSPLEYFLLNILYREHRDMSRRDLVVAAKEKFDVTDRKINSALFDKLQNLRYITSAIPQMDDGDADDDMRISITSLALSAVYSKAYDGPRAGGPVHVNAIFKIMDAQLEHDNYCIMDKGDKGIELPDLLVYRFKSQELGDDSSSGRFTVYDPDVWSEKITAIEVERQPSKHPNTKLHPVSQVYKNFVKNHKKGYAVSFVTFSEKSAEVIRKILAEHDVGVEEYDLIVTSISTPSVEGEVQDVSLSSNEESVIRALADVDGATVSKLSKDLGLPFSVMKMTVDSLVRKGILEKSGSGSYHSADTCHKKKDLTASLPTSETNPATRPFIESDVDALLMLLNSNPDNPDKVVWEELVVRGYEISMKSNGEFKISKSRGT